MMKKIAMFLILNLIFFSCEKEKDPYINLTEINFDKLFNQMELECGQDTSSNYFKGILDGQEVCHYGDVDGRKLFFGVGISFSTSKPEFSSDSVYNDLRRGFDMEIRKSPYQWGDGYLLIEFPNFAYEMDTLDYFDSIFSIAEHKIFSYDDVVIPENTSPGKELLLRYNGGYLTKFKVQYNLIRAISSSLSSPYPIGTIFGPQENSYLKVISVEKSHEVDGTYYTIELAFECDLYFWPQTGREGLWSRLKNGQYKAKFRATRR